MTPTTVTQLTILIAFVIPGIVYQAVRARLAGESPQNRDTTNKVLRALAASVVLASIYLIVLGPLLVDAVGAGGDRTRAWIATHPRQTGLLALALLFAVPAAAASAAARRWRYGQKIAAYRHCGRLAPTRPLGRSPLGRAANRILTTVAHHSQAKNGLRYEPTPTAWDWAVDHGGTGVGFVRVLGSDTQWRGGAFSNQSYFTTFPEPPALYVEQAWQIDDQGAFVAPQDQTRGAWIPCTDALTVEFTHPREPAVDTPTQ